MKTAIFAISLAAAGVVGWFVNETCHPRISLVLHDSGVLSHASFESWQGYAVVVPNGDHVTVYDTKFVGPGLKVK